MWAKLRRRAKQLKSQIFVLFYAYRDRETPWYAKLVSLCVVAYAFSPIDLIPDFVPLLGHVDDLILIPLGIRLALRLIPRPVLERAKVKAEQRASGGKPTNWIVGALVLALWAVAVLWVASWFVF